MKNCSFLYKKACHNPCLIFQITNRPKQQMNTEQQNTNRTQKNYLNRPQDTTTDNVHITTDSNKPQLNKTSPQCAAKRQQKSIPDQSRPLKIATNHQLTRPNHEQKANGPQQHHKQLRKAAIDQSRGGNDMHRMPENVAASYSTHNKLPNLLKYCLHQQYSIQEAFCMSLALNII